LFEHFGILSGLGRLAVLHGILVKGGQISRKNPLQNKLFARTRGKSRGEAALLDGA